MVCDALLSMLAAWAIVATAGLPAQAAGIVERWERRIDAPRTNQPILAELYADGSYHVVVSTLDGDVTAYDGATGDTLWSTSLDGQLTDPVVGFFGPDGSVDVAVVGREDEFRTLSILDGATGDLVVSLPLESPAIHAPSPFPLPAREGVDGEPPLRHGIAVVLKTGVPVLLKLNDAGDTLVPFAKLGGADANKLLSTVTGPPAVGRVFGEEEWGIVVAYASGLAIIPINYPDKWMFLDRQWFFADSPGNAGVRSVAAASASSVVTTPIIANVKQNARIDGTDFDQIIWGMRLQDSVYFAALEYNGDPLASLGSSLRPEPKNFTNVWERGYETRPFAPEAFDPIAVNMNTTRSFAEVALSDPANLIIFDMTQGRLSRDIARPRYVAPPSSLFVRGGDSSVLTFSQQGEGSEVRARVASNMSGDSRVVGTLPFQPARVPIVGELDGNRSHHEIVFVGSNNRLHAASLTYEGTAPGVDLSFQTSGGTAYRSGGLSHIKARGSADPDPFYLTMLETQREWLRERLQQGITDAQAGVDAGDLPAARAAIDIAYGINPRNSEAASLNRSIFVKERLIPLILGGLAVIVLVGGLIYIIFRVVWRMTLLRSARQAAAAGDAPAALERYHKLFAKLPNDASILEGLSETVVSANDYSPKHVDAMLASFERKPDDTQLLEATTRCLIARGDTTQRAFTLYRRAEELLPDDARLKYLMGMVMLQQGDKISAQDYLRHAIRLPGAPDHAYEQLAALLLEQGSANSKTIEVFERAFFLHPEDSDLLKGLALSLIDAKRHDAAAQAVYEKMLVHDPGFTPAIVMLCQAKIQAGQIEEAVRHAHRVQQLDPDNRDGIMLLSQCYLIQSRADETAIRTFQRATSFFPDDRDIVSVLARTYIAKQRTDPEAVETIRRAFELNQNDPEIAAALARHAASQGDTQLTIRTVEKLIEIGVARPNHFQLLADAYLATDTTAEKADRVFREALKLDADNRRYIAQLAKIGAASDRVDPEALKTYEVAYTQAPSFEIGRRLVKAYFHNDMWDKIPTLAQKLLLERPEDTELQKIFAQASLQSNRMDEAIAQYESVLANNPDDRDAVVNLALAYAQKGSTDERSFKLYRRAIELNSSSDLLWMMIGRVYLEQSHEKEAANAYRKAVGCSDQSPERVIRDLQLVFSKGFEGAALRWLLAELLTKKNRLREACEQLIAVFEHDPAQLAQVVQGFSRILEIDPQNQIALVHRGVLLKTRGDFEQAERDLRAAFEANPANADAQRELVELYQAILRERPDDIPTRHRLGEVHVAMEDYDKAIGCFQRSAADYRFEAEALKALGMCFVQKDMLDLALQEFKKVAVDDEMKEILYDLARRYEAKRDLVGAKTVYKQLFAADIDFRDVRQKYEQLAGSTSDPMVFEATMMQTGLSPEAARRYELIEELGRGAMGIVYKAKDKELDEVVALKILPETISNNPEAVKRFRLEARNARRLAHPNIIRIHDIGEEMGRKYISMEYVEGSDLKQKFRGEGPPGEELLVEWIRDIGGALNYAHQQGIVHRDIKPANIMLTGSGAVKVADFGIAKALDIGDATMTGAVMGTPLYMSPEQVMGSNIDHRADIYSMGIMLYEFASGRPPFTEGDLAYQHMNVDPKPLGETVRPELETLIMKCLAKDREHRWASCGEMVDYLDSFTKHAR